MNDISAKEPIDLEKRNIPLCPICNSALGDIELNLNRLWHFDCEFCTHCKASLSGAQTRIEECLKKGIPVSHTICEHSAAIQDLRERKIPATIQMLEAFNNDLLVMQHSYLPPDLDVSLLQKLSNTLKESTTNAQWLLSLTKDKINIKIKDDYQETLKTEKEISKAKKLLDSQNEIAKAERSAVLKAERDNPELRARRRAVEGLMKSMNMSQDEAEAFMEQMAVKAKEKK